MIAKEPNLKYTPAIASWTFSSLLKTDPQKAFEYGKMVIVTPTYAEPAYSSISGVVDAYADKLDLPPEFFLLAIEAYQAEIDNSPYPKI